MKPALSLAVILTITTGIAVDAVAATGTTRHAAPKSAAPKLRSLIVSPIGPSAAKGAAVQFTATAKFSDGAMKDVTAQANWRSSNRKIVTIKPAGLATVLASKGTATITVVYGGRSASARLTAYSSRLRSLSVSPNDILLTGDANRPFSALGIFTDGSVRDLTSSVKWKTSSRIVASVSSTGLVSAAASWGTTSLLASYGGTAGTARVVVAPKLLHREAAYCGFCHPRPASEIAEPQEKVSTLTETVPALCYECHAHFLRRKSFHAPVEGGVCTACHDPHDKGTPGLLALPVRGLCLSCHADVIDHDRVHGPAAVGDCSYCHDPHSSANEHLLTMGAVDLCISCHFDIQSELKKRVVHPALEAGCTSCHDPHGSETSKFLPAEGAALCFSCHPAIESKVTPSGQNVHQPIRTERGCASCHTPHASDAPKLLPKAGKDLCLDCHKDIIGKSDTVLHGPIKTGVCIPCHDPHGSPNEKLLVKPYSSSFYVSYSDTEFPLCFRCHTRSLVSTPVTSTATRFRDGDRNLHYLHVNRKDLGKRCKACHVVHGGPNPRLVAATVPFGTWKLPLNFKQTANGGSCAPGCHQPFTYTNSRSAVGITPLVDKDKLRKKKP